MNKILVLVYVPLLDSEFDVWIPCNQKVGRIKTFIINTINELIDSNAKLNTNAKIYDKETSVCYQNNIYVKDSGIKNGSKIILM